VSVGFSSSHLSKSSLLEKMKVIKEVLCAIFLLINLSMSQKLDGKPNIVIIMADDMVGTVIKVC
jgi:hypothetical protein